MKKNKNNWSYEYTSFKRRFKSLMVKNYKVVSKKLKTFTNKNLTGFSSFGRWYFNDSVTDLESVYLLKKQVEVEMKGRGLSPMWCEQPLREFDKTLKFKK